MKMKCKPSTKQLYLLSSWTHMQKRLCYDDSQHGLQNSPEFDILRLLYLKIIVNQVGIIFTIEMSVLDMLNMNC